MKKKLYLCADLESDGAGQAECNQIFCIPASRKNRLKY